MTRKSHLWTLALLFLGISSEADDRFPTPAELQPDVDFWVDIFSFYSTSQGVLHDNRDLAIVYEVINLPADLERRSRQRQVAKRREHYQAILRTLAGGKRENLSEEEARVLGLWPEGVSNQTLSAAVRQIRYQLGLRDRFRDGLERAGRGRAYIENECTALGVPIELAALPHVESSYNPEARSHVGASGIWQFTRSTGRRFMRVDHVLDERNDPFIASQAAGKLLAYNYSIAG
ncbi:MAG: transglycosylase SLT domain-containing protein, partial [Gammaproteobacteria bacterium]|nr:transglycosylase SLT domain-containing protein [Gammaproteobacteria bacterium]